MSSASRGVDVISASRTCGRTGTKSAGRTRQPEVRARLDHARRRLGRIDGEIEHVRIAVAPPVFAARALGERTRRIRSRHPHRTCPPCRCAFEYADRHRHRTYGGTGPAHSRRVSVRSATGCATGKPFAASCAYVTRHTPVVSTLIVHSSSGPRTPRSPRQSRTLQFKWPRTPRRHRDASKRTRGLVVDQPAGTSLRATSTGAARRARARPPGAPSHESRRESWPPSPRAHCRTGSTRNGWICSGTTS